MTSERVSAVVARYPRLAGLLLWTLMATGFGGTGWIFGVKPIAVMIHNWQLAQHYREVDARIVSSNIPMPDGSVNFQVGALYDVDGKPYYTERLTLVDDSARDEPENAGFANSLRSIANSDTKTKVWVDATDPRQAVVSRFLTDEAILRRASLAIAFSLLALVGVAGLIGAIGNFGYYRRFERHRRSWLVTAAVCAVVFPLRRLFIDPDGSRDDDFFEFVMVLEGVAGVFIFVALTILFGKQEDADLSPRTTSAKKSRNRRGNPQG